MLEGMRAPRSVRVDDMRAAAEAPVSTPLPVESDRPETVYVAKDRCYRVQVTAPRTYSDPATGIRSVAGEMIVAVFAEGVYRNNDRNPEKRALIDKVLQANPYFGKFGSSAHFWLASDQRARTADAQLTSALNTLRALPKSAVDKYVAELQLGDADDHVLGHEAPLASP